MKAYVGVTDSDWYHFLAPRPHLTEINFWKPSADAKFSALTPGEVFFFKSHYPHNRIVGWGFFSDFIRLPASQAWEYFGEGNGAPSAEEMINSIRRYRERRKPSITADKDPEIGCIILNNPVFLKEDSALDPPADWAPPIVQGKTYTSTKPAHKHVLDSLFSGFQNLTVVTDFNKPWHYEGPTHGEPKPQKPRRGQGAFQARVLKSYAEQCAISSSTVRPTLQAAHILPVEHGGQQRTDNGILLRADLHILFDRGYLGVDTGYRVRVSPRLAFEFSNVDRLCDLDGRRLRIPERSADHPNPEYLEWHTSNVFQSS
ncbi:HNH endonuclease [Nocardiopsis rhodophaea]|uniref:HNH endonuclease n=1 Tax=Nocardiopsis rhodophaea TaxID=280238 RepID=UPI0031DD44E0